MTTSDWLLLLEPCGDVRAVRTALAGRKGIQCRMEGREMLVVVTETESAAGVEEMRRILSSAPDVRRADLIRSFQHTRTSFGRRPAALPSTVERAL